MGGRPSGAARGRWKVTSRRLSLPADILGGVCFLVALSPRRTLCVVISSVLSFLLWLMFLVAGRGERLEDVFSPHVAQATQLAFCFHAASV